MKKIVLLLIVLLVFSGASFAQASKAVYVSPLTKQAIRKFKAHNYTGAIQDCQKAIATNPNNAVAQYYLAVAYVKIGDRTQALDSYQRIINSGANEGIVNLARRGSLCISSPEKCHETEQKELSEMDKFVESGQFLSDDIQKKIREKELNSIKEQINQGVKPNMGNYPVLNKSDATEATPSDKQIADAVRTLAKVGYNPLNMQNMMTQDPQISQMNMMLGDYSNSNNNNGYMNMLPFLVTQSQGGQMNPQLIQSMMMSQLIPDFGFDTKQ